MRGRVYCTVGDEENLEGNTALHREPVKVSKDWCDLASGVGMGEF